MKVAVFFGGRSCEHNISLITGRQTLSAIGKRHETIPVLIDREGGFYIGKNLFNPTVKRERVLLCPGSNKLFSKKGKPLTVLDAAVLATHGYGGEDGCLQGLLTLCAIPFTGSGVAASSAGMDKLLMKKIFEREFLPVLPYVGVATEDYRLDPKSCEKKILETLRFPMIVKPASLGSSIGISVAHDAAQLHESIQVAAEWDNTIAVENALENFTELNCAAIGSGNNIKVSEIEQPVSAKEFLSFEDKYVQKGKSKARVFPADIPLSLREKVKSYTIRAFQSIGAAGVARVDFLFDGEHLYVNEINTIPGALSNYLFPDLPFPDLIDELLSIARQTKTETDRRKFVYESAYSLGVLK